ncbi:MAG: SurA N-terminal domain-containing protein [Gemmatimonadota bacterium]|nr:SurA N-terminal domain-containing protein [Gemmatimonadota bacterium]MDH3368128.1 SurA N-terminal domain-containing protein [Gemmatimonadota bacterium]MDH3479734.1 SurA N-terminal domain-containing protein [Gemmatimonadota bacterium]MDH3569252.1 SurA N-terminal domain-containing protein [Gemmatimonadota bacterium]MDH5549473.1 SurA N-terminal domain-containing protein [Gemmatimonadota bacterium]
MMRTMRGIAPWIMVIVAVSFVGWMVFEVGMDIGGQTSGGAANEVVRVNGRSIDLQTFYTAVRNQQELRRQQGIPTGFTLEEQRELEDAVVEQMIQEILLEQEYRRRGITATDREIREALLNAPLPELQQVPEFQTDGQFDLAKYQRYLRSGADPNFALALEARYRQEIPRYKFLDRITSDVYISDAKLWRIYRDRNDSVVADVMALVPQVAMPEASISLTEDDLDRYFRAHRSEFERPAQAFLSFVAVSRRPWASDSARALERAREIRQELLGGADFAEVAGRESADSASRSGGGDLGEVPRGSFVPAFEEAALALRPGQISEPVLTQFGYHLIRLESKRDTLLHTRHVLVPIELYGEHLAQVDRQADSLDFFAAEAEDPRALDDVAAGLGVPVAAAPPLYQGNRMQLGRFVIPDVHLWAFETPVGQTSQIIETDWAFYVFRLDSLNPKAVPGLQDIRQEVTRAATLDRQWVETRALAQRIAEAIGQGADLATVADSFRVRVQRVGPFTRLVPSPAVAEVSEAIGAAFGASVGQPRGPFESNLGIFFVEPIRRTFADSTAFVAQKDEMHARLIQQARQARVQLIMTAMRDQASVTDNRREIERQNQQQQQQQGQPFPSPVGF